MKLVIGLTGTLNSGKGTLAGIIKLQEFEHVILSNVLLDKFKEDTARRNAASMREYLQDIGDELRRKYGSEALAKFALEQSTSGRVLIDGIRNPGEIDYLKTNTNFYLIAVDAPLDIRYARSQGRKSEKDSVSFEEFKRNDERDRGINQPGEGQQVQACIDRADYLIINDDTAVKEKVLSTLKQIFQ